MATEKSSSKKGIFTGTSLSDGRPFTAAYALAPGVLAASFTYGTRLQGTKKALIAAGLVEPKWFAQRTQPLVIGGFRARIVAWGGGWEMIFLNKIDQEPYEAHHNYDGNKMVPWSACGWCPRDVQQ